MVLTLDDSSVLIEAAAAGIGIALAREFLVEAELKSGCLKRLYNVAVRSNYSYWFVWNPSSVKLETIGLFRHWLKREFASPTGASIQPLGCSDAAGEPNG